MAILIDQKNQVRGSRVYKDLLPNNNNLREISGDIRDPLYSEATNNLEEDLNLLRTQVNSIIGSTHWYDAIPNSLVFLSDKVQYLEETQNRYHNVESDIVFTFVAGNISEIVKFEPDTNLVIKESFFVYNQNNIESITKIEWNTDNSVYINTKKTFIYNSNNDLIEIQNRTL